MAREATITQEQVNAAADSLRAAGTKPTVRAVREKLGNIGGNATVIRLLDVWKAGQVRPVDTPITLPAALQRALVDFVAQAVAEGKADVGAELAELQQVKDDLASESERQALVQTALEEDLEAARRDRDAQAGRARQLEEDLGAARADAEQERAAAEAARTDLAKALLRLEAMPRLESDLRALRAELEREHAGRVAGEQAAAVAAAKLEGEVSARVRLEADLAKATSQAQAAVDEVRELTAKLAEARIERLRAEKDLKAAHESQRVARRLRDVPRKRLNEGPPAVEGGEPGDD